MANITIDDKSYDLDSLSREAKAQLFHLQAIDMEIGRMNVQLAVFKTARMNYAGALKAALDKPATAESDGQPDVAPAGPVQSSFDFH